ncbi:hypothetical protein BCR36DRAFT_366373 [Piromyces finnis]|uniref:G-protein coupled receptors family 2 profile 2 domain-containing protein n=1 Tax=Piromyces finnis TaxID=1754191 RepID=A0A1Y1VL44_9FUNG|nr:hypothetical protein BCR36DRAFT_366373 [Piromyces finnis]|eukprot:ORX59188.1 hypothetical protein BCR36DRAFT_366373 [Piromyces finnis]
MAFTDTQNSIIQYTIEYSSILSIIGSGTIIISTFYTDNIFGNDKFWNRIIFFMSFWDLCASINILIANHSENSKIQNVILHFFFICSILCAMVIAMTIFCVAVLRKKLNEIEKYENFFHFFIWIISFILTIPFFFLEQETTNKAESTSLDYVTFWSFKNENYEKYQLIFFFGPIWIVFIINSVIFISLEIVCRKRESLKSCIDKSNQKDDFVVKRTCLYLFILFITWIWGTLNNIQDFIEKDHPVFILHFLFALFTPLQGFLNSLVYFWYNVLVHIIDFQIAKTTYNNEFNDITIIDNCILNEESDYSTYINQSKEKKINDSYFSFLDSKTKNNDYTLLNESSFSINRLDKSGNYYMYGFPVLHSYDSNAIDNILDNNLLDSQYFSYNDEIQNSINITIINSEKSLKNNNENWIN